MSDKVKELAEKLSDATNDPFRSGKDVPEIGRFERILRAELEPLLEKARAVLRTGGLNSYYLELAAELQNWTARNPDGR